MKTDAKNGLTVVIPTFNRSQELVRALDSLVAQTDADFEVIVCDDGSTEDIAAAIQGFYNRLRLQLLRIDNSGGPARPRNVAMQVATTQWISYLDSDDWWFPARVANVKAHLDDRWDIVYHPLRIERADRDAAARPPHGSQIGMSLRTSDPLWHMVRFGNPFPLSGTTVRRDLVIAMGGFEESVELIEDFDLWLRLASMGARIRYLPEQLGSYWVWKEQISKLTPEQFLLHHNLYERQLDVLPAKYKNRARSNFAYLLGSYALDLGLPCAGNHFSQVLLKDEPLLWLKAHVKQWHAHMKRKNSR